MAVTFRIIFLTIGIIILTPFAGAQCYELLWADEFDYTGYPDPANWTPEEGGGGWGNNEVQYYTVNDLDNAKVENGLLTITALEESYENRDYTSARLITRGKFNVQYGKIEARMKLPYGQGIWPAFWMMGESITEVGWPACGEIDIMEFIGGTGRENKSHGTIHWDNNGSHASYGSSFTLDSGIFADDFHTFSIEWTPQVIRWYVDDQQFHVADITPAGLSEFHDNFFILLNLAVGGNWPGYPDETTVFPQTLDVDYVRVFKNSTEITEVPVTGNDIVAQKGAAREFSLPYSPHWTYHWSVPADVVILHGKDSSNVLVNWGCEPGTITCQVTGACDIYEISKAISVNTEIHGPMFISENQENILFHTDTLADSDLTWSFPDDVTVAVGEGTDSVYVHWGTTFENIVLTINNSCGTTDVEYSVIRAGQYPFPEIDVPHPVPGIIEAVEFDYGGAGVAYNDITTGNEGSGPRQDTDVDTENNDNGSPNVGWISNGEWLEYTISVDSASYYTIELRVATANAAGGPFSFLFNGVEKLSGITVFNTGGWASFKTVKAGTVYLTTEDTLMRVNFNTGGFNLGKMAFIPSTSPDAVVDPLLHDLKIHPVPASEFVEISGLSGSEKIVIYDMKGSVIREYLNEDQAIHSIDLNSFGNGFYFINIQHENGLFTAHKLIKIN